MLIHAIKSWQNCSENKFLELILVGLIIILALLFYGGCTPQGKTTIPTYEEARDTVLKEGPAVDPPVEVREKLPEGTARSIKQGEAAPHGGVLLSEEKAALYIAIKAERDRRRSELEAERIRQRTQALIYSAAMQRLKEETKTSWWDRNKGVAGFAIGTTLGMAVVLGLVYGLTKGNGINTITIQQKQTGSLSW